MSEMAYAQPRKPRFDPHFSEVDVALAANSWLKFGTEPTPRMAYSIGTLALKYLPNSERTYCLQDMQRPIIRQSLANFTAQHNAALCC